MRHANQPTPRLDKLIKLASRSFRRRGVQAQMARACGVSRPLINKWFRQGKGRPTATATLLALRFLMSQPESTDSEYYFPTWPELIRIVIPLLSVPGNRKRLAAFCRREPHFFSRYLSKNLERRREADGEVALATLEWKTKCFEELSSLQRAGSLPYKLNVRRAVRRAFLVEDKFRDLQIRMDGLSAFNIGEPLGEARGLLPLPSGVRSVPRRVSQPH